jgi:kynurenine formamidase
VIEDLIRDLSNWGRWGDDDEFGTVNLITPQKRLEAAGFVRTGHVISLALPLGRDGPQPPFERRLNPQHVMLQTGTELEAGVQGGAVDGWGYSDDMVIMALQAGTHWDALAHAFYDYKMYNGRSCSLVGVDGAAANSITAVASKIVTRGVLLDVARQRGGPLPSEYEITVADIEATLESQASAVSPGDALLFRTGYLEGFVARGDWSGYTYGSEPGPGVEVLRWLATQEVAAVASDTWAFEVLPSGSTIMLPFHAVGIVHVGLLVGENFRLDVLSEECATDGRYEFMFVGQALPLTRAVGSPVNPLAIR